MRILMPIWFLDILDRSFILPLMRSISQQVDKFHVVYVEGEPKQEWKHYFSFERVDMPYSFVGSKIMRFYLSRRKLHSQVKAINIDGIFTLSALWMQEFSRYCSRKMGVPYVVRLRGNHRLVRKAMKINPMKESVLNYLETKGLKEANLVIPNSVDLAKKAEEWGVKKENITSPVWNGVDTQMFRPMKVERSSDFTVAYAGRLSPEKRVPHLLRAAQKLAEVHFIIAGRKEMAVSFPQNNIEYLGELPISEMPEFYNRADLIVLPSVTEGFPNVILEAYACGKPVLVAKEAFPQELKEFGSVANIDNFESEVKALEKTDLRALGRRARHYVEEHFRWEKFGKSIIKHLEAIIT